MMAAVAPAWHSLALEEVAARLGSDPAAGLEPAEAARRLAQDGANELRRASRRSALAILLRQLSSLVIWVLLGAAGVSFALGATLDATAILAIVALNAAIGF